jgi:hypothetical protein
VRARSRRLWRQWSKISRCGRGTPTDRFYASSVISILVRTTDRGDSLVYSRVGHSEEPHPHRPRPTPVRTLPPAFRDGRQSPERERDHDPTDEIGGIEGLIRVVPVGEGRASWASFCAGYEVAHGCWSRGEGGDARKAFRLVPALCWMNKWGCFERNEGTTHRY